LKNLRNTFAPDQKVLLIGKTPVHTQILQESIYLI